FAGKALSSRRREIQYIDRLFNWAGPGRRSMNLIGYAVRGPDWVKPSEAELAAAGADADKAYTHQQLRDTFNRIRHDPLLNACGHLGFGSAFSPIDCASLRVDQVDLDNGLI